MLVLTADLLIFQTYLHPRRRPAGSGGARHPRPRGAALHIGLRTLLAILGAGAAPVLLGLRTLLPILGEGAPVHFGQRSQPELGQRAALHLGPGLLLDDL